VTYRDVGERLAERGVTGLRHRGRTPLPPTRWLLRSARARSIRAGVREPGRSAPARRLHTQEIDGATLAYLETDFVSKASFMLAPSLRDIVSAAVCWPVLAIAPAHHFQYLWSADRTDIIGRLGPVISREYLGSPYPLSTEVFRIGDTIKPICAIPGLVRLCTQFAYVAPPRPSVIAA
jgi:hypothetical protein